MSNDTARQIEEMARLFVEAAVDVLGDEGAGTFDTMKPSERAECVNWDSAPPRARPCARRGRWRQRPLPLRESHLCRRWIGSGSAPL